MKQLVPTGEDCGGGQRREQQDAARRRRRKERSIPFSLGLHQKEQSPVALKCDKMQERRKTLI